MIDVKVEGEVPEIAICGREAMRLCSLVMREGVEQTFHEGGYPGRWQSLANGRPATLYRTGALYSSLTPEYGEDWAEVQTPVFYGKFLHFGTRKMVARPFMLWREDMKEEVVKIVGESVRFINAKEPNA